MSMAVKRYRLITLDYHADTMPCYNRYSFNMQSINASVDHNEEKNEFIIDM